MTKKINYKYLTAQIDILKKSATDHRNHNKPGQRRFWMYDFLRDVYRVYRHFESLGVSEKVARKIVKRLKLPIKRKSHLIRVLIEASVGTEDNRTKIKWTNALRYAFGWLQQPERLAWFFEVNGGIAGCVTKYAFLQQARLGKTPHSHAASSVPPAAQSVQMPMPSTRVADCATDEV